ncbi:MAG: porin family protein, partial [Tannerellaceae bacterium]|nr:porin family protein [Tannerellaceae bacterium]
FTLLVLTGLTVGAKAQDDAKLWIGGTFNVSTFKYKGEDNSTKNFEIAPEIGVNLSDSWGLGLAIGYAHVDGYVSMFDEVGAFHGNAFSIAPFARYTYFKRDLASLFVDGGIKYTTMHALGDDNNLNSFEIGIRPGLAFNVAPNIQLLTKIGFLGYEHAKYDEVKADGFGLNFDLSQIQLGVNFLF